MRTIRMHVTVGTLVALVPGLLVAADQADITALEVYPSVAFVRPGASLRLTAVAYDR